jgi:selenium metabolism protein YedF
MNDKVIDCRGMACPLPVVETKKALDAGPGKTVTTIVDNETARENVSRLAKTAGYQVAITEKEGLFYLHLTPAGEVPVVKQDDNKLESGVVSGVVYFISANSIGQGSPDLGEVLMKSLMTTLAEQPPEALLFMNTGVFMVVKGSPVLDQLGKISRAGTEILVCGTCLDYYKLKDKLTLGMVSNMYEINSRLLSSDKVITVG